jgi:hypothetical protein
VSGDHCAEDEKVAYHSAVSGGEMRMGFGNGFILPKLPAITRASLRPDQKATRPLTRRSKQL